YALALIESISADFKHPQREPFVVRRRGTKIIGPRERYDALATRLTFTNSCADKCNGRLRQEVSAAGRLNERIFSADGRRRRRRQPRSALDWRLFAWRALGDFATQHCCV